MRGKIVERRPGRKVKGWGVEALERVWKSVLMKLERDGEEEGLEISPDGTGK